ncbi:MAG TPA: DUF2147 domain-containing protein [Sphingomicrobium sp.]|nr:DUF2147 domain-containing protein [Sphingomicrobium sp.]
MLLALLAMIATDPASIEGHWKNPSGRVTVLIETCGEDYCGTVIAAAESARADARRGGTEQLVGTQLMTGFKPAGPGKWRGRMFVPDLNHRSKAELRMLGPNQLKVTGCAVGRMICKSQLWTRAD